jgi:hypothetical protein
VAENGLDKPKIAPSFKTRVYKRFDKKDGF